MKMKESGMKDAGMKKKDVPMAAQGAAQGKTGGKLREVNAAQSWFTLEDGSRFELAKGVSLTGKPGESVSVVYESKGGKKIATRVGKTS